MSSINDVKSTPPELFAAGDTLIYFRDLTDYLPSAGWAVRLTVSQPGDFGTNTIAQAVSTADSANARHTFNVANFLAGIDAGVYILSEEVFNTNTGEKHQISFSDNFIVTPGLDSGAVAVPVKTTAQQMLELLTDTLKDLYKARFQETDVQKSRFVLQKSKEVLEDYKYWSEVRRAEIMQERIRKGLSPGNVTRPFFAIGL